jgi:hypothetical protein
MFLLSFQTYVASVFIGMLYMFSHKCYKAFFLDVAYIFNGFSSVFSFFQVFQTNVSSVSSVVRSMLQIFHLDISKVDGVLHMLQWRRWLADSGLPQSFNSFLVRRVSPSPLVSLPSLPFPSLPFLHLDAASSMTRTPADAWWHDERAKVASGWSDGGHNAHVVAPQQAEVHGVCLLRARNRAIVGVRPYIPADNALFQLFALGRCMHSCTEQSRRQST